MTRTARRIGELAVAFGALDKVPADLEIQRTHAGHHQRSDGAWSWTLWSTDGPDVSDVGSRWPASELLALPIEDLTTHTNEFGQTEIRPKEKPR